MSYAAFTYVDCGIDIGIHMHPADLTDKNRLTLAIVFVNVATMTTLLGCVCGIDSNQITIISHLAFVCQNLPKPTHVRF